MLDYGLEIEIEMGFQRRWRWGWAHQRHAGVVVEVRIPFFSAKKERLGQPNKRHQDCIAINAHSKTSVHKVCY